MDKRNEKRYAGNPIKNTQRKTNVANFLASD